MDVYTFKTKLTKAYINHLKSLHVDFLENNHLQGKAKDCVGSLEDLNEIWVLLLSNFGDTEKMPRYQFKKVSQLGLMKSQKT